MSSIFSSIIAGEIPCHRVWEDDDHLAFLDIRPIQPGHCLVIPKREVSYIFDLEPADYAALWAAVRIVEKKLRNATACSRVIVSVIGWEVPHVHVHLIPTSDISEFQLPGPCEFEASQFETLAARIQQAKV
ncbi:MAG: HIT family protein [Planctomycetota bacterium]|nr:HIT family protein [Planctomycetota bacterium]